MTGLSVAEDKTLNRREFLYYIGGAGLALLTVGTCGGIAWYTLPNPHVGDVAVDMELLNRILRYYHHIDALYVRDAHSFLAFTSQGMIALDKTCPFDNQLGIVWYNNRFYCTVCGTEYRLDGTHHRGPAQRGMDRFGLTVIYEDGRTLTSTDGSPVYAHGTSNIVINTYYKIFGAPRS